MTTAFVVTALAIVAAAGIALGFRRKLDRTPSIKLGGPRSDHPITPGELYRAAMRAVERGDWVERAQGPRVRAPMGPVAAAFLRGDL